VGASSEGGGDAVTHCSNNANVVRREFVDRGGRIVGEGHAWKWRRRRGKRRFVRANCGRRLRVSNERVYGRERVAVDGDGNSEGKLDNKIKKGNQQQNSHFALAQLQQKSTAFSYQTFPAKKQRDATRGGGGRRSHLLSITRVNFSIFWYCFSVVNVQFVDFHLCNCNM
jgi:hypothetical protein